MKDMPHLPSPAVLRNAQVRRDAAAAFPDAGMRVHNGDDNSARLTWTDGPSVQRVDAALWDARRARGGPHARWQLHRTVTADLYAAACFHARDNAPTFFYRARDASGQRILPGDVRAERTISAEWPRCWAGLDADLVTGHDLARARTLLSFERARGSDLSQQNVAAAVYHGGAVIDTIFA